MEFVNQTVIGSKELAALSKGARKTMRRNRNRMVRTMAALVIALNVFFAWVSLRAGDSRWWLNGALALFLLVIVVWEDRLNGRFRAKHVLPDAREVTASFGPEGYTHVSKASDSRFTYDQIRMICETPEHFLFYLDRSLGQIYRKDGFTKGTAMAFREFIAQKTGLTVRNI
ncbi:MAG: YcxB family protein [Oscillospiraceae bacterium]|jgi:hypothetical protein|nr:YcxB family protein [Oscillospiraceae bacterium]